MHNAHYTNTKRRWTREVWVPWFNIWSTNTYKLTFVQILRLRIPKVTHSWVVKISAKWHLNIVPGIPRCTRLIFSLRLFILKQLMKTGATCAALEFRRSGLAFRSGRSAGTPAGPLSCREYVCSWRILLEITNSVCRGKCWLILPEKKMRIET